MSPLWVLLQEKSSFHLTEISTHFPYCKIICIILNDIINIRLIVPKYMLSTMTNILFKPTQVLIHIHFHYYIKSLGTSILIKFFFVLGDCLQGWAFPQVNYVWQYLGLPIRVDFCKVGQHRDLENYQSSCKLLIGDFL